MDWLSLELAALPSYHRLCLRHQIGCTLVLSDGAFIKHCAEIFSGGASHPTALHGRQNSIDEVCRYGGSPAFDTKYAQGGGPLCMDHCEAIFGDSYSFLRPECCLLGCARMLR